MIPDLTPKELMGLVLMLGGGGWFVVTKGRAAWKWIGNRKPTVVGDKRHNTDALPPEGFTDHAALIVQTAPTAPDKTLVKYCLAGLTEAAVFLAERKRLEAVVSLDTAPADDTDESAYAAEGLGA